MTRLTKIVLACALAFPVAAFAQATVTTASAAASGVRAKAGEIEVRATVVELDMANRTATLKGPKGKLVTVNVPAEVKNFDQVLVGDELVVRYMTAVAAKLEPVSNNGIRERVESTTTGAAPAGGMPGALVGRKVEILADVKAIDTKAGTATLRGATRTFTIAIPEGMDVSKVKVGSQVRAVFVEAVVLNVEHVAKPAAPAAAAKPAAASAPAAKK
ncbi:hypothetical protein [Undibacterium sp. Ren11W]|uniref:hypothetical protein n=1 Tax=Undibacterium sp. Ren11W TaxID=3413045 RepID=UPI003BF3F47D